MHLLETTELSLDEVAPRVGYQDASTLWRVLHREMRLGVREIRARRQASLNIALRRTSLDRLTAITA